LPFAALQVTDLSVTLPCTVAVNVNLPPVCAEAVPGETDIEVTVATVTVILADADFVLSALLVAVTVAVPADGPAVKSPAEVIDPEDADHVTDLSVTLPCTVAVSRSVAAVRIDPVAGVTVMEVTVGALTVMVTEAVFVGSATLAAVTVAVPAVAPAVNSPAALTVPDDAVHVTVLFVTVPCTVALSCNVAPVRIDPLAGVTVMEVTFGALTVMVPEAVFVGSATLVAVTVAVPAVAPAVKSPAALTVPEDVLHVTVLFVTVPCTFALSCSVAPVRIDPVAGVTVIEFTVGAFTVMVAIADFVVSATLVTVTVTVPAVAGAVSSPALLIDPPDVFHVTVLFVTVP
jgi:hypothetical protein